MLKLQNFDFVFLNFRLVNFNQTRLILLISYYLKNDQEKV